jgi:pimeloyl-ACP methyl ester carboxylesterase
VRRPDLVGRPALVSCAFAKDGMIVRPQAGGAMPEPLVAMYADVSPDGRPLSGGGRQGGRGHRGRDDLTAGDVGAVGCPTLVMAGDDDIVTLDHTVTLYRSLPRGELAVVPNTSHLLLHEKPELCVRIIGDFLDGTDKPRMMPIGRS